MFNNSRTFRNGYSVASFNGDYERGLCGVNFNTSFADGYSVATPKPSTESRRVAASFGSFEKGGNTVAISEELFKE